MNRVLNAAVLLLLCLCTGCNHSARPPGVPPIGAIEARFADRLAAIRRIGSEIGAGWDWDANTYRGGAYCAPTGLLARLNDPALARVTVNCISENRSVPILIVDRIPRRDLNFLGPGFPSAPLRKASVGLACSTGHEGNPPEYYFLYEKEICHYTNASHRNQVVMSILLRAGMF